MTRFAVVTALLLAAGSAMAAFETGVSSRPWEQTAPKRSFTVFVEREELSALDKVSRMIFAVQLNRQKRRPLIMIISI